MGRVVPPRIRHLFRALFRKASVEAELDQEFRNHLELEIQKNIGLGMEPSEAHRRAMLDFGGVERYKEAAREVRGVRPLETAASELRFALRRLVRAPVFTGAAVLTLGLGIGATITIYTVLERVVLDPLPYPEPQRLVRLKNLVPAVGPGTEWESSSAQFFHYGSRAQTLEAVAAYNRGVANVLTPAGPQRAHMADVSASLLGMLGIRPTLGRLLDAEDDRPGAPPVVVLSHSMWAQGFGSDPGVLGQRLSLNGEPHEIIGVTNVGADLPHDPGMPPGMETDLWVAKGLNPEGPFWNNHVIPLVGRLAPTASVETAQADLDRLVRLLPDEYPSAYSRGFIDNGGFRTRLEPLKSYVVGDLSRRLWILLGAVGLVLLVACANVVNLFLVRMEGRRRELAVRSALGAGTSAVLRSVLAESLLMALGGTVVAIGVSLVGTRLLVVFAPATLQTVVGVGLDGSVFAVAVGISLVVALALTALSLPGRTRTGAVWSLVASGGRHTTGKERQRVRSGLVVTQVALALILLVGAGLLLGSFRALLRVDPGFDPAGTLTTEIYLPGAPYDNPVNMWGFYDRVLQAVRAVPGVVEAGMSDVLPFQGGFGCTVQAFEDQEVYARLAEAEHTTCAGQEPTTPGYLEAMGIPLLQGRTFVDADNHQPDRGAVVVSQAFAQRFWPGEDPIGKGVAPSGRQDGPFYHVVGVVGDVYSSSLEENPAIAIYYPIVRIPGSAGWWPDFMNLAIKTDLRDPLALFPDIRRAVSTVDPTIPLANPREGRALLADSMSRVTFTLTLLGVAAAVALFLAAIGLFGVVSYLVARRRNEIGVRVALGARPRQVEGMVVVGSLRLAAMGMTLGFLGAVGLTRVLGSFLYGVEPLDPVAYLGAGGLVLAVGFLASWIPSRRAVRIDPVEALRVE